MQKTHTHTHARNDRVPLEVKQRPPVRLHRSARVRTPENVFRNIRAAITMKCRLCARRLFYFLVSVAAPTVLKLLLAMLLLLLLLLSCVIRA